MISKTFRASEDSILIDYFDELEFSFEEKVVECIQKRFTNLLHSEVEDIFHQNYDAFSELMYDLKDSDVIMEYCTGEEEIEESSGTWGYLQFEIDDIQKASEKLGAEVEILIQDILDKIE